MRSPRGVLRGIGDGRLLSGGTSVSFVRVSLLINLEARDLRVPKSAIETNIGLFLQIQRIIQILVTEKFEDLELDIALSYKAE